MLELCLVLFHYFYVNLKCSGHGVVYLSTAKEIVTTPVSNLPYIVGLGLSLFGNKLFMHDDFVHATMHDMCSVS